MDLRGKSTKRRNKIKNENDRSIIKLSDDLSQSMASLATLDSGVGTISSAPSIESIDSLIAVGPSKKCKKSQCYPF